VEVHLTFAEAVDGVSRSLEVTRHVACETCGGNGAKPGTSPERCQTCGGRGQVLHQQGFFMIGTTCPSCRGEGSTVRDRCKDCRGSGAQERAESLSVSIPAGVDDGQRLRLAGKGENAPRGGIPGNLYVDIHVTEDPRFKRDGADVYSVATVSFATAALGGAVEIPTLDQGVTGTATLDIEAGTQPGTVHVRKNAGITRLDGYGRGTHFVEVTVDVPRKLTARQRELLLELAAEGGGSAAAGASGEEKRSFSHRKKRK
jgi:molecular chaperone DnaJ